MKFLLKESYSISLQSKAGFLSITFEIKPSDVSNHVCHLLSRNLPCCHCFYIHRYNLLINVRNIFLMLFNNLRFKSRLTVLGNFNVKLPIAAFNGFPNRSLIASWISSAVFQYHTPQAAVEWCFFSPQLLQSCVSVSFLFLL